MANIRDITSMCKSDKVQEAYELAKNDFAAQPNDAWQQRALGWALYYMIKNDTEKGDYAKLIEHIDELKLLDQLNMTNDGMIFDNVQFKIAEFIKNHVSVNDINYPTKLSTLFLKLKGYNFSPSKGHSFLLQSYIKFSNWQQLVAFLEWWNIGNLLPEDFKPFKTEGGKTIMSLAERVYIAYSKALLHLGDKNRIKVFIPQIEMQMQGYPDMMYLGYFCGKLMLTLGTNKKDSLKIVIPFVQNKKKEFWAWQLLSEVYKNEKDNQQACLLRAAHCKTKEVFLGKLRIQLIAQYISQQDYARAKYHLDKIVACYLEQGWHLPIEVQDWTHQSWVQTVKADESDGVDYIALTNKMLAYGANKSVAVVTYIDNERKRVALVYGKEQRAMVNLSNLNVSVKEGTPLIIHWLPLKDKRINVVDAELIKSAVPFEGCTYVKLLRAKVIKREDKQFAFIKVDNVGYYISQDLVKKHALKGGENISTLAVYNYNKKKDEWSWSCVSMKKI